MGSKQDLKEIIIEMMSGDVKKAIKYLNSTKNDFSTNKIQMNILIALSQITNKQTISAKIVVEDVKKLVSLCCTKVFEPTEAEISNYYKSLYHIFKFLRDKLSLQEKTTLYNHIFPIWLTPPLTNDTYEILSHFNSLISNDAIIPNIATKDTKSLLNLLKQHLHLLNITYDKDPTKFYQKFRLYINILQKNNEKNLKDLSNYFFELCKNVTITSESATDVFYELSNVILLVYDVNKPEKHNDIIQKLFKKILECNKNPELGLCTQIFERFYQKIVKNNFIYSEGDAEELKRLRCDCERVYERFGLSSVVFRTFYYLSDIIRSKVSFFDNVKKDAWCPNVNVLVDLIKIFDTVSKVVKNDKYVHKCQEGCTVETNLNHAFTISSLSATFLNLSLRYNFVEGIERLNDVAVTSIKSCLKFVSVLKSKNCVRWTSNWRLIGALIYNIGTKFYQIQNFRLARFYFKMLVTHIGEFESKSDDNRSLIADNCLANTLNLITNCYSNVQKYREALPFLAFALLLSPETQKFWSCWMNIKFKANNADIGNVCELTTKDILETDANVLKEIYPNFSIKENEIENLLLVELRNYTTLWASKIPIKNAAKQIFDHSTDPYVMTVAFSLSWEKTLTIQDETYSQTLSKTIDHIYGTCERKDLMFELCLANLHFIEFQLKSYEVFKKNLTEMNENVRTSTPEIEVQDPPHPDDQCDINPTYYNNKIENNLALFKILFKTIDIWTKIFQNPELLEYKSVLLELGVVDLVKRAALELRVQNYRYKMLKVWFLYLQLGKILENNEVILSSIGFILENIDCSTDLALNLREKAVAYIGDSPLATVATFYLNLSYGYFKNGRFQSGIEALTQAKGYLGSFEEGKKVFEARILHLESLYLQKGCNLSIVEHDQNFIYLAHTSFGMVADYYKNGGAKCLYTLSVLFDISFAIGGMYRFLRMPRETRCYTSECVLLSQQIVLPLRTAQFFALLASTDLLGHRFDDCQVKISGIDYILYQNSPILKKNSLCDLDERVVEINKDFQRLNLYSEIEVMLDVPVDHRLKNLQGSPILEAKSFQLPSFLYHLDCACFYCTNFDFLRLCLECTHLEACFFMQQNNNNKAAEFFKGALRVYRGTLRKYESKNLSPELLNLFKKDLNVTYASFLLDYSVYFAKKRNETGALRVLHEIIDVMGESLRHETFLQMELLFNKVNFLSSSYEPPVEAPTETTNLGIFLVKTPENKVSTIKIEGTSPLNELKVKKRFKKELKFDLSDAENDKSPIKRETFKIKVEKTPAPTKIKIYTPGAATRKVKPLDISPKNTLKVLPIIPQKSPEHSSSRIKSKKLLDKNTKLLTQKLKNEIQKEVLKESSKLNVKEKPKVMTRSKKTEDVPVKNVKKSKENIVKSVSTGRRRQRIVSQSSTESSNK